jgi:hypothetical protein
MRSWHSGDAVAGRGLGQTSPRQRPQGASKNFKEPQRASKSLKALQGTSRGSRAFSRRISLRRTRRKRKRREETPRGNTERTHLVFVVSFSMRRSSQRARGCREHIDVRNTSRKPGCRTRSCQASFSDSVVDRGEWPAHRMGLDLRLHCEGEGRSERSTLVTIVPQMGA